MKNSIKYSVTLNFEEIKLPPFEEILVLGKNSPQGKTVISKAFDCYTDFVFVNKRILAKIPKEKILETNEYPYGSENKIIKDDFKVNTSFTVVKES